LQCIGCKVLAKLAALNHATSERLGAAGACDAAAACLTKHKKDTAVLEAACTALSALAGGAKDTQNKQRLGKAQAVEAVVVMLMAHAAHAQLYAAGCAALAAATAHNSDNRTVAAECDAAAAVTAGLKAACAAAAGTATAAAAAAAAALHAGAATVAALCTGSEAHAKAFGETGTADVLAAALAVLHSDEQFAQLVAAAAAALLKHCADNKARLKKAGLLQAAMSGSSGAVGAGAAGGAKKGGKKGRSRMASSTGSEGNDDERGRRAMTCA
jgi:trimeric autotransporter adhesin